MIKKISLVEHLKTPVNLTLSAVLAGSVMLTPAYASPSTISSSSYYYEDINAGSMTPPSWSNYNPAWETPGGYNITAWNANISGGANVGVGGLCGAKANAYYMLTGMMQNLDQIYNILTNPQNIEGYALAGALYLLGTYFPIIKEAIVGFQAIANSVAKLAGMNCQSAMNLVMKEFKDTSKITEVCVLHTLGISGVNIFNVSQSDIQQAIASKGQDAVQQAFAKCEEQPDIFTAFSGTSSIAKFLNKFDPRKWLSCSLVKWIDPSGTNAVTVDGNGNIVINQTAMETGQFGPRDMAAAILASMIPSFEVGNNNNIVPQMIYISGTAPDGSSTTYPLSFQSIPRMTHLIVDTQMNNMFQMLNSGSFASWSSFSDYVSNTLNAMITRYGVTVQDQNYLNQILNGYFRPLYYAVSLLNSMSSSPSSSTANSEGVALLQGIVNSDEAQLESIYRTIVRKIIDDEIIAEANKTKQKVQAKIAAGQNVPCG